MFENGADPAHLFYTLISAAHFGCAKNFYAPGLGGNLTTLCQYPCPFPVITSLNSFPPAISLAWTLVINQDQAFILRKLEGEVGHRKTNKPFNLGWLGLIRTLSAALRGVAYGFNNPLETVGSPSDALSN